MAVHQLLPTFTLGDATGQSAIHLRLLLRRLGIAGGLYAGEVAAGLRTLVQPASALRPAPGDLVLYHHGIASHLAGTVMHLPCKRGVVFHNISPAQTYVGSPLHEPLVSGRAQLAALADQVDLSIGVSEFNCAELRAAGHRNVHRVNLFVEPERFGLDQVDPAMAAQLASDALTVLSVSRVLAHKRFEDLLCLHEELLRVEPEARLLLVGGYDAGHRTTRELLAWAKELPGVRFLGRLSHGQLVAAYRAAHVYVSMSEHEGFGVPLLEAMAAELPVLAFAAAAVPETLGGAGIAFNEKRFAPLAELVREIAFDEVLRRKLRKGQARRLEELSATVAQGLLEGALAGVYPLPSASRAAQKEIARGSGASSRSARGSKKAAGARPRVAFVAQRYGEVSGGSELLCRQLADKLSAHWDVTVLTTCARDHLTWANELPEGESHDGKVRVLRFPTIASRAMRPFNALSRRVFDRPNDRATEEHWVAEQGPLVPGLFRHLEEHAADYDGFVVMTYLYATAAWGLPMVADRALLVSTAHDEAPIRFGLYDEVFSSPHALVCLTPEEAEFIEGRFPDHAPISIASVGIDFPKANPERFRAKHGLEGPYLFYVGRVEEGKGVGALLAHHRALVRGFHDAPTLVLAGASSMTVAGEKVRSLGRISDEDKVDALAGALAVVAPSRYESLSLLTLEAFAQGTPVLANGESEVLAGQLRRSGGGFTFTDAASFREGVQRIGQERAPLSKKALAFARKHSWDDVVRVYRARMDEILKAERKAEARR